MVGFPGGSVVKESAYNAEDAGHVGLIPGSGVSPGGGPRQQYSEGFQYSGLENPMDRAWRGESDMTKTTKHTRTHVRNDVQTFGLPRLTVSVCQVGGLEIHSPKLAIALMPRDYKVKVLFGDLMFVALYFPTM